MKVPDRRRCNYFRLTTAAYCDYYRSDNSIILKLIKTIRQKKNVINARGGNEKHNRLRRKKSRSDETKREIDVSLPWVCPNIFVPTYGLIYICTSDSPPPLGLFINKPRTQSSTRYEYPLVPWRLAGRGGVGRAAGDPPANYLTDGPPEAQKVRGRVGRN